MCSPPSLNSFTAVAFKFYKLGFIFFCFWRTKKLESSSELDLEVLQTSEEPARTVATSEEDRRELQLLPEDSPEKKKKKSSIIQTSAEML